MTLFLIPPAPSRPTYTTGAFITLLANHSDLAAIDIIRSSAKKVLPDPLGPNTAANPLFGNIPLINHSIAGSRFSSCTLNKVNLDLVSVGALTLITAPISLARLYREPIPIWLGWFGLNWLQACSKPSSVYLWLPLDHSRANSLPRAHCRLAMAHITAIQ